MDARYIKLVKESTPLHQICWDPLESND